MMAQGCGILRKGVFGLTGDLSLIGEQSQLDSGGIRAAFASSLTETHFKFQSNLRWVSVKLEMSFSQSCWGLSLDWRGMGVQLGARGVTY